MNLPYDWIAPEWPAPAHVKALVTTRNGGVSRGAFSTFNLGMRAGDDPQAVRANREALRRFVPREPKWLAQVHGACVIEADDIEAPPQADAAIARGPDTVCAILIADCVPVLLTDRAGTVVAAAHAGWRGVAGGVIENTVRRMEIDPRNLLAYLGPGIGPEWFEVGDDVREAFIRRNASDATAFSAHHHPGKWLADLFLLARRALARTGVTNVSGGGICTASDPQRFFSYRRDGVTGRMAALVWREGRP